MTKEIDHQRDIHKIVLLSAAKFSEREYQIYGIDIIRENGFIVEIWDGSKIIYPRSKGHIEHPHEENGFQQRIFLNIYDLKNAISLLDENTLIMCPFSLNFNTFQIFKSLSKNNIPYCVFHENAYPIPQHYYQTTKKYKYYFSRISKIEIKDIATAILNKVILNYYFCLGIKPATYVLVGGTKSTDFVNTPIGESTQQIKVHAMDYDIYLEDRQNPENPDEKLCVFIDTYSPTDPDRFYHGTDSTYHPTKKYYHDMRSVFDYIERNFGYKIVILSHPTMDKDLNNDYFGDRDRVHGKTANFVKRATCVLSHESTAINFAILFKKPILFLTSEEIDTMQNGQNIKTMASALGKSPVYIDQHLNFSIDMLLENDISQYQNYIRQFIKETGDNIPSWQIFSNFLKNI